MLYCIQFLSHYLSSVNNNFNKNDALIFRALIYWIDVTIRFHCSYREVQCQYYSNRIHYAYLYFHITILCVLRFVFHIIYIFFESRFFFVHSMENLTINKIYFKLHLQWVQKPKSRCIWTCNLYIRFEFIFSYFFST